MGWRAWPAFVGGALSGAVGVLAWLYFNFGGPMSNGRCIVIVEGICMLGVNWAGR